MTAAECSRMSAREFAYWNHYLMLKPEDLQPADVTDDLMKVFGGPHGR